MSRERDPWLPEEHSFRVPWSVDTCRRRIGSRLPTLAQLGLSGRIRSRGRWPSSDGPVVGRIRGEAIELQQQVLESPFRFNRFARLTLQEEPSGTRVAFRMHVDSPQFEGPLASVSDGVSIQSGVRAVRVLLSERWKRFDEAETTFLADWLRETLSADAPAPGAERTRLAEAAEPQDDPFAAALEDVLPERESP